MKMRSRTTLAAGAMASIMLVAACSGGTDSGGASEGDSSADVSGTVRYWLWDSNQQPAYEQCAADFEAANEGVSVEIEQYGWDDYFQTLTTSLVGGDAPDVITNHPSFFPQLALNGQLLPIDDIVESGAVDLDAFRDGLADRWVAQDGQRYGVPKDWDTVATLYNTQYLADAGLTAADLADLEWNPVDGGTWEATIARLTVDANGVRGDEPGFDSSNVEVYGLGLKAKSGIGAFGQTQWSPYALSNDWTYADQNPFGSEFNYGDERFIESVEWWSSLIEKGYMPSYEAAASGVSIQEAYGAGRYAMVTDGSWNARAYFSFTGVDTAIAPLPIGPDGSRTGVMNGLADSVLASTQNSAAAKAWVAYLGSTECQDIVAEAAVVFPAVASSSDLAIEAFAEAGIDASVYYDAIAAGEYELAPIADHWSDILAIMEPAVEAVLLGQAEASSLTVSAEEVNALFD